MSPASLECVNPRLVQTRDADECARSLAQSEWLRVTPAQTDHSWEMNALVPQHVKSCVLSLVCMTSMIAHRVLGFPLSFLLGIHTQGKPHFDVHAFSLHKIG